MKENLYYTQIRVKGSSVRAGSPLLLYTCLI